jgi:hypothetical protein
MAVLCQFEVASNRTYEVLKGHEVRVGIDGLPDFESHL